MSMKKAAIVKLTAILFFLIILGGCSGAGPQDPGPPQGVPPVQPAELPPQSEITHRLGQDWQRLTGGREVDIAGTLVAPDDFDGQVYWGRSPDQQNIAFILSGPYISLTDLSVSGFYDGASGRLHFSQILLGDAAHAESRPTWSSTGEHFAYTLSTARGASLAVMVERKDGRSVSIGGYTGANFLPPPGGHIHYGEELLKEMVRAAGNPGLTGEADFFFKNLEWSQEGGILYFAAAIEAFENGDTMEVRWSYDAAADLLLIAD